VVTDVFDTAVPGNNTSRLALLETSVRDLVQHGPGVVIYLGMYVHTYLGYCLVTYYLRQTSVPLPRKPLAS
jgi:hypothetical protein